MFGAISYGQLAKRGIDRWPVVNATAIISQRRKEKKGPLCSRTWMYDLLKTCQLELLLISAVVVTVHFAVLQWHFHTCFSELQWPHTATSDHRQSLPKITL